MDRSYSTLLCVQFRTRFKKMHTVHALAQYQNAANCLHKYMLSDYEVEPVSKLYKLSKKMKLHTCRHLPPFDIRAVT